MSEKHWLVEDAESMPLGGLLDPLEHTLTQMFVGACRELAGRKGILRPKARDYAALIAAEYEAQKIVERRRANLPVSPSPGLQVSRQ